MTSHKHLKQLVRARMAKTGERYATARRQIVFEGGAILLNRREIEVFALLEN